MEEKTLLAFAKGMQSKDQQLASVPVEQLAAQVAQALQTPEGQKQLAPLFQQFQAEVGQIMRNGGKMRYAINRLSSGGETPPVQGDIPRKNYEGVWYNGHLYRKGQYGGETTPDPDSYGHEEQWGPVYGHDSALEDAAVYSPSTKGLDEIRNDNATHHPAKRVYGSTAVLVTRFPKITEEEARSRVANGEDFSKQRTWGDKSDSTIVVIRNPEKPESHSNQDGQVKAYRKYPVFRAISEGLGYKPSFIRYSEEYNKK